MDWGPYFGRRVTVGMHLDNNDVQGHLLDLDAHNLFPLQVFKHPIEHPILRPAVHMHVNGMPVAKSGGAVPAVKRHELCTSDLRNRHEL